MRILLTAAMALWVAGTMAVGPASQSKQGEGKPVKVLRQTPILMVDKIEPHLDFYEKRLGYKRLAEVPHGAGLGFVMLEQNGNHLMMQTRGSAAEDLGASAADPASREKLLQAMKGESIIQFTVVDSIDAVIANMAGVKQLVPLRTTSYGMKEIVVQDSAGYVIVFAQETGEQKD